MRVITANKSGRKTVNNCQHGYVERLFSNNKYILGLYVLNHSQLSQYNVKFSLHKVL